MEIFISKKLPDRTLHETGRCILEYVSKNILKLDNSEIKIINKKPCFKYSAIHFSISHSKDIAGVCFDIKPVGFDIEKIRDINFESISTRMNFKLKEGTREEFFKCWTKYESEYKLQTTAQYFYTTIFNNEYALSVASCEKINLPVKTNVLFSDII